MEIKLDNVDLLLRKPHRFVAKIFLNKGVSFEFMILEKNLRKIEIIEIGR